MTQASIFRWRAGRGWLVLSGRGDFIHTENDHIVGEVLSRTVSPNPLAYVWAASNMDQADRYLEYVAELGGRTGYLVDIVAEDDETLYEQISGAGIIVLGDGPDGGSLLSALEGAAMQAIEAAYANGATVFGQGAGALALGQWMIFEDMVREGQGWLENALVFYDMTETHVQTSRDFLTEHPDTYSVGFAPGAALAFSPQGTLEVWGNQQITVALGKNLIE